MKKLVGIAFSSVLILGVQVQADSKSEGYIKCRVTTMPSNCGTGDVELKVINLKDDYTVNRFEINHGDLGCWGMNTVYQGFLDSEKNVRKHPNVSSYKMHSDKGIFNRPVVGVIGQLKLDLNRMVARLKIEKDYFMNSRGTEYHLQCVEIKRGEK